MAEQNWAEEADKLMDAADELRVAAERYLDQLSRMQEQVAKDDPLREAVDNLCRTSEPMEVTTRDEDFLGPVWDFVNALRERAGVAAPGADISIELTSRLARKAE